MGKGERDIECLCPSAKIERGLAIHGADVQQADEALAAWARPAEENA